MPEAETTVELTKEDVARTYAINAAIPGWSGPAHYLFFKAVLAQKNIRSILVLGIYHGRDIAYILDLLARFHPGREIEITGVDRFSSDPCADWTPAKEVRTWESEVHGPPPNYEAAVANTRDPRVRLIKSDDFDFLENTMEKFDAVYLDTAHDFDTVTRQLRQVPRVCRPGALLCGDDFSDRHTWGVASAVGRAFDGRHRLSSGWIWYARVEELQSPNS